VIRLITTHEIKIIARVNLIAGAIAGNTKPTKGTKIEGKLKSIMEYASQFKFTISIYSKIYLNILMI
jgi:hypothetical protein